MICFTRACTGIANTENDTKNAWYYIFNSCNILVNILYKR